MARATQVIPAVAGRIQTGDGLDTAANTNGDNQQVWAYFGDSLIAGTSATPDASQDAEPDYTGVVYDFNGTTINEITTTGLSNTTTGSPWTKFGQTLYELTQKKIVICNPAAPGSTFYDNGTVNSWWSSTGTRRAEAITKVTDALAAAGTTEPRSIILGTWVNDVRAQGTIDDAEMLLGVQSFFNWLEATWPGIPVYVVKPGRTETITTLTGRLATMHGYLDTEISTRENVHEFDNLLNYLPEYSGDNLHLTQWGNELMATKGVYNLLNAGLITNNPLVRTYDANSIAVQNRFTSPSDFEKDKIHDYIQYINRKGITASNKHMFLGLFDTEANSAQDWFSSTDLTIPSGSWVLGTGYLPDGTIEGAININITPSADAGLLTNDTGIGIWLNDLPSPNAVGTIFGCSDGTRTIQLNTTGSGSGFCVNALTVTTFTTLNPKLWFHLNRSISTTHSIVRLGFPANGTVTSVGKPTVSLHVGALNVNGVLQDPTAFSAWLIGIGTGSLSSQHQSKIRGLIADFLVKKGYF